MDFESFNSLLPTAYTVKLDLELTGPFGPLLLLSVVCSVTCYMHKYIKVLAFFLTLYVKRVSNISLLRQ